MYDSADDILAALEEAGIECSDLGEGRFGGTECETPTGGIDVLVFDTDEDRKLDRAGTFAFVCLGIFSLDQIVANQLDDDTLVPYVYGPAWMVRPALAAPLNEELMNDIAVATGGTTNVASCIRSLYWGFERAPAEEPATVAEADLLLRETNRRQLDAEFCDRWIAWRAALAAAFEALFPGEVDVATAIASVPYADFLRDQMDVLQGLILIAPDEVFGSVQKELEIYTAHLLFVHGPSGTDPSRVDVDLWFSINDRSERARVEGWVATHCE